MKNFGRFSSSVTCEGICLQNLLATNIISSRHGVQYSRFLLLFLHTALPSDIFSLPIRSPRFLFCLYAMIDYFSNSILRFQCISNKCQCLLIICRNLSKGILFWPFSFAFASSNAFLSISHNNLNSVSKSFIIETSDYKWYLLTLADS